ncbi:ethanolamine utilization protein [Pueribacillus theae]|uniref:Ethanolamine utilization protein n=1 Tax=Pueribacillus theae TaxID=2171751 RepID=A0A2U1JRM7_9BACI|nr:cupin domain-containing protein [Pueribacillus theae]PWA07604.1 ethanolamine utilization protein [Pueribacillus theae]
MGVKLFKKKKYSFEILDGTIGDGKAEITRFVTDEISPTLGGGIVKMEKCKFPWTVRYDEILYITEGEVIIEANGEKMFGKEGDSFFIEKETSIVYEATSRGAFMFSLYPANWNKN